MVPASGPWADPVWPWSRPADPTAGPRSFLQLQQLGLLSYQLLLRVLGASSVPCLSDQNTEAVAVQGESSLTRFPETICPLFNGALHQRPTLATVSLSTKGAVQGTLCREPHSLKYLGDPLARLSGPGPWHRGGKRKGWLGQNLREEVDVGSEGRQRTGIQASKARAPVGRGPHADGEGQTHRHKE